MLKIFHHINIAAGFCILIFGGALASGCDTNVVPVVGTDQAFTLFGLFTPQMDTQRVLVFPIEGELRMLPGEPLDVRFTSEDAQTGEVLAWSDSLIEQENGGFNHLFWHPLHVEYGRTYLVSVEDGAGRRTTASVVVPPENEIVLREPTTISDIILPVIVQGGVPNLLKVELYYGFDYMQTGVGEKLDHIVIPMDDRVSKVAEGWLIRINLSDNYDTIRDFIRSQRPMDNTYGIDLLGMQLSFIAANEEWSPPGGVFDPEVLVQPGTMTNVSDGFGFIGAGYRTEFSWSPADSIARAAGFR